MSWSHEQVSKLIDLYEEKPCLYVVKSTQYKNKHMRAKAYSEIETELNAIRPEVTVSEIKSKLNGLRTNFLAEYRKYVNSLKSGSGEDQIYESSLWYYDRMTFILEHVAARSSIDSIKITTNNVIDEPQTQDDDGDVTYELDENVNIEFLENLPEESCASSGSRTPVPSFKCYGKKRRKKSEDTNKVLESANNTMLQIASAIKQKTNCHAPQERDDIHIFGEFVVSKLSKIQNIKILNDVQENIMNILFEAIKKDST